MKTATVVFCFFSIFFAGIFPIHAQDYSNSLRYCKAYRLLDTRDENVRMGILEKFGKEIKITGSDGIKKFTERDVDNATSWAVDNFSGQKIWYVCQEGKNGSVSFRRCAFWQWQPIDLKD